MTDPTPPEATPAMRHKADLMVGLFVGAVVAVLGGVVALVTGSDAIGLGSGLIVVGVLVGIAAVVVLRSITPEERALLTPAKAERESDPESDPQPENG